MTDLVYLACPYSHDDPFVRRERFEYASRAAAELMAAGLLVFSPISHTHPIAEHGLPKGWDFWEKYDRAILGVCKAMIVLMLEGWRESVGVQAEIQIMRDAGKPIHFIYFDGSHRDVIESLRS